MTKSEYRWFSGVPEETRGGNKWCSAPGRDCGLATMAVERPPVAKEGLLQLKAVLAGEVDSPPVKEHDCIMRNILPMSYTVFKKDLQITTIICELMKNHIYLGLSKRTTVKF